ncbi:hypothetical protein N7449_008982 [Penicillium cf. viridicatum]|uniref:FAD-binding domain-containing protein n=1 Tax=Penicillium cf. viridicatum TaxID=2972119 RepID=A0A9W9JDB1_9EURO|nr:hypothetical protein N7449_008982 [Penicillium cf. viridicatum]
MPHTTGQDRAQQIDVIIVGLGIAGLTAAIECHLNGHNVIAFEKTPTVLHVGDIFSIGSNAESVIRHWEGGAVSNLLNEARCAIDEIQVFDETGKLQDVKSMEGYRVGEGYVVNRAETVTIFFEYAQRLGIDLRFGASVTDYWENADKSGVIVDGVKIEADCVIATDGIHSKAREAIFGAGVKPKKTGSAIYRSGYSMEDLKHNPAAEWLTKGKEGADQLYHFIGKDITVLVGTGRQGKDVYWGCMHKSLHDVSEPWLQVSDVTKALEHISKWGVKDRLEPIMASTPKGKCFDHLVLTMDPLPSWVSPKNRMMLLGDAAHPLLPNTGQGANQAIEDGATVAICLKLAGKSQVTTGLRVAEKLRYQRVAQIQELGHHMLKALQNANWEGENEEESPTMLTRPAWICSHDCQQYAHSEFHKVASTVAECKK